MVIWLVLWIQRSLKALKGSQWCEKRKNSMEKQIAAHFSLFYANFKKFERIVWILTPQSSEKDGKRCKNSREGWKTKQRRSKLDKMGSEAFFIFSFLCPADFCLFSANFIFFMFSALKKEKNLLFPAFGKWNFATFGCFLHFKANFEFPTVPNAFWSQFYPLLVFTIGSVRLIRFFLCLRPLFG